MKSGLDQAPPAHSESIRRRYGVTLIAQILRWALSFIVSAGLVPRRLGPVVYGNFNFLSNASSTLRGFLDPSAQQAFFTFSSQDERSGPLTKLYSLTLLGQMLIVFILIGFAAYFNKLQLFFPDQKVHQIMAITVLDWLLFMAISLQQLGDCKGLTVYPQLIGAVVAIVNAIALVGLALLHKLNLLTYVWMSLVSAVVWISALGYWLLVLHSDRCWDGKLIGHVNPLLRRWWRFASPLILLEYCTPVIAFLSTYFIQIWYGSNEQGNYMLALRWCSPALAFTSAGLMIFWREIAHWTASGQWDRAKEIHLQFNHILFFMSFVLATWMSLGSSILIPAFVGQQYAAAVPVLMIMAFYPVIQTSGHLSGASFKATERTVVFRNLSIMISIADLFLTYFLLAKRSAIVPGMQMGAIGLALKMVVFGFFATEVYAWLDFRYYRLSYGRWLVERSFILLLVGSLAILTLHYLRQSLQSLGLKPLSSLALASTFYFAGVSIVAYVRPGIIGLTRQGISKLLQEMIQKVYTGK